MNSCNDSRKVLPTAGNLKGDFGLFLVAKWMHPGARLWCQEIWCRAWVGTQSNISEMRSMYMFRHRVCFLFARVERGTYFALDVLSCGVLEWGVFYKSVFYSNISPLQNY